MTLTSALLCLSMNIFMEARGESINTWSAVGYVTINRVEKKDYPNSICNVVNQKNQFNWKRSGMRGKVNKEREVYEKIKLHAGRLMERSVRNPIGKRIYFNHYSLGRLHKSPFRLIRIGKLVFY
jgi:spore germination cell wall hydrolase CwlJ-like protein